MNVRDFFDLANWAVRSRYGQVRFSIGGIFRFKTDHTVHRAGYPGFHPRRLFGAGIRTAPRRSGRLWLHRSGARPAARPPPAAGKARKKAPRLKAPGSTAGVLLTVFGGIGLGLVFLAALIVGLAVLVEEDASFSAGLSLGVFLPLLLLCVGLLAAGGRLRSRARRYRQYRARIGGASFCPIELLASYTGNTPASSPRICAKIRLGLFPDAHIDEEETCLMLIMKRTGITEQTPPGGGKAARTGCAFCGNSEAD